MKSRVLLAAGGVLIAFILLSGACSAGFIAGRVFTPSSSGNAVVRVPGLPEFNTGGPVRTPNAGTPKNLEPLFAPFWQSWNLIHDEYVDQPVNDETLMQGAIRGMLEALGDPHSSYLDPNQYERSNATLNGDEYEGIGAWVDVKGEFLTIISPMPGSPAEKAGLRPGDEIIAVNGEDMTGVDGETVRQKVIGPKGTTVRLTIQREGKDKPFDVSVERASIVVPTVEGKMLENKVAYVHLFTFGDQTAADLRSTLKDLLKQEPQGLILDLRNNGGGYLDTAIAVASEFIGDGVVMYEQYGDGSLATYEAKPGGLATKIPMAVLINEGSASASEIVAGAIQDRGRGKLVGVTSFGKGSVQNYTPLINNEGAVRITIARWLTPNKRQIHQVGLEPDVKVEITQEDFQANRDPQLEAAVKLFVKN